MNLIYKFVWHHSLSYEYNISTPTYILYFLRTSYVLQAKIQAGQDCVRLFTTVGYSQIMFYPVYHTHSGWKEMLLVMHQNLPIAFVVWCLILILVLICHLRTCPQAESVEKQLLAKWMTCTLSLDVSPFKNVKVKHWISYWHRRKNSSSLGSKVTSQKSILSPTLSLFRQTSPGRVWLPWT